MKVLINPKKEETGSGLTSWISWENPTVYEAIKQIFNINSRERLVQLEVNETGITVRLETIPNGNI